MYKINNVRYITQSSPTANSSSRYSSNKEQYWTLFTHIFCIYFEFILYFQGGRTHSRSRSDSMLSDEFADILAMKASSPLGRAHTMEQGHWQQITGKKKNSKSLYLVRISKEILSPKHFFFISLHFFHFFFFDYFILSFFSKFWYYISVCPL